MKAAPLVSPHWLKDNLQNPKVRVIENAWDKSLYTRRHIPGAIPTPCHPHLKHFDADGNKTAHLLRKHEFARFCRDLGLRSDQHFVIYDDWHGLFAARFWWVCRYYGMKNISVLDGGWQGWRDAGYPIDTEKHSAQCEPDIEPREQPQLRIERDELRELTNRKGFLIWDTRRAAEYTGGEPSDNLHQGHIPGAINLDWTSFLEAPENDAPRFILPLSTCRQLANTVGLGPEKTIIPYCQSGIRAAFGYFLLYLLNYNSLRLYDGSLFEWANSEEAPMER